MVSVNENKVPNHIVPTYIYGINDKHVFLYNYIIKLNTLQFITYVINCIF